ncbi:hypothetical protein HDU96_008126 [Phlyctochytrium bullatum]|nr:hypothetical protein HDU96_008126 [Phlyctochytrium bullatum]
MANCVATADGGVDAILDSPDDEAAPQEGEGVVTDSGIDRDPEASSDESSSTGDELVDEMFNLDGVDEGDVGFVGDKSGWNMENIDHLAMETDYSDKFLLECFKKEAEAIVTNLKSTSLFTVDGHSIHDIHQALPLDAGEEAHLDWISSVTPWDIVKYCLSLSTIKSHIIELLLLFYGISPTRFFSPAFKGWYHRDPLPTFTAERYQEVLNRQNAEDPKVWKDPIQPDDDLDDLLSSMSKNFTKLALIKGFSILSLDDDHLRLRSSKVIQVNLHQINNAKKGLVLN